MKDLFNREINYLRISITDRCNLRCQYCMPSEGVEFKEHTEIISYEEIINILRVSVDIGINKIRITGGEPLVRKGIVDFIRDLRALGFLKDISMTTNGTLLPIFAKDLKKAGLDRLNISMDSLQREKYAIITRRDRFKEAMNGINIALESGFNPIKINVVVMRGVNDDELMDFVNLSRTLPLHVRFIEFMPLGELEDLQSQEFISLDEIKEIIKGNIELNPAMVEGNGPAEYYKTPNALGTIGFITPISNNFCSSCNRIRLTSDGKLRPCLASNLEVDMHDKNGEISNRDIIREKLIEAIRIKPKRHHFLEEGYLSNRNMSQIGG
jgi:GTP 3',8-cyclase